MFSRPVSWGNLKNTQMASECVILGNGPSLKQTLRNHSSSLQGKNVFCVNDFVASEQFEKVKPGYFVFMDPVFWSGSISDRFKKVCREYVDKMEKVVDWDMIIFLPAQAKRWNQFQALPQLNNHIRIFYVNTTEIYCCDKTNFFFYRRNLAMPPMQNVLSASIFVALNLGYKKIYITGADHSWHESVKISEKNILYLKNDRFQDSDEKSLSPFFVDPGETTPYRMDNLFRDLSKMFASYLELERYSRSIDARIYNASEKSFIDAFERRKIK